MRVPLQTVVVSAGLLASIGFLVYSLTRSSSPHTLAPLVPVHATATPVAQATRSATPRPTVSQRPTPAASSTLIPVSSSILAALNAERSRVEVAPLASSPALQAIAQSHASDMAAKGYFSHTDPGGITFEQRIESSGVKGKAHAENIGLTSGADVSIVTGWMGSEGHRTNLLNAAYHVVGIGTAHGLWQGQPVVFIVAVFGNEKE